MSSDTRKEGFYCVRRTPEQGDDWIVAQWIGHAWLVPGETRGYFDGQFTEIDERRIERTPPRHPGLGVLA